jgi:hypothetical protein
MDWRMQIVTRAIKARIPLADTVRRVKRAIAGYRPNDSNINSTLHSLRGLKAMMDRHGVELRGAAVLEIGSGWFPIAPMILKLSGAKTVYLTDIVRRIDTGTFETARQIVAKNFLSLAEAFGWQAGAHQELNRIRLEDFNYVAPFQPEVIEDGSLDLVLSRAVLEHIPVTDLRLLLLQLRPKLKSTAHAAHAIDNSDHYEHHDKTISRVNFLTWTERRHRLIYWLAGNNGENRLRHHEYAAMFRETGYRILAEDADVDAKTLNALPNLSLQEPYRSMHPEQVAALSSYFLLGVP